MLHEQEIERQFTCPHCWQLVTVLVDPSVRRQNYIEDCEVCCNPIHISYEVDRDGFLVRFDVNKIR